MPRPPDGVVDEVDGASSQPVVALLDEGQVVVHSVHRHRCSVHGGHRQAVYTNIGPEIWDREEFLFTKNGSTT